MLAYVSCIARPRIFEQSSRGRSPEHKLHQLEASSSCFVTDEGIMGSSEDNTWHQLHDAAVLLSLQVPFQLSILLDVPFLSHRGQLQVLAPAWATASQLRMSMKPMVLHVK